MPPSDCIRLVFATACASTLYSSNVNCQVDPPNHKICSSCVAHRPSLFTLISEMVGVLFSLKICFCVEPTTGVSFLVWQRPGVAMSSSTSLLCPVTSWSAAQHLLCGTEPVLGPALTGWQWRMGEITEEKLCVVCWKSFLLHNWRTNLWTLQQKWWHKENHYGPGWNEDDSMWFLLYGLLFRSRCWKLPCGA